MEIKRLTVTHRSAARVLSQTSLGPIHSKVSFDMMAHADLEGQRFVFCFFGSIKRCALSPKAPSNDFISILMFCSRGPQGQFASRFSSPVISHPYVIRECRSPIAHGVIKGGSTASVANCRAKSVSLITHVALP